MESTKWAYFQFRKAYGHPVFVRFKETELHSKFSHLLKELGFSLLSDDESKNIALQKITTKLLTIQEANSRLEQIITGSDILDMYGHESLSLQSNVPVYTYRRVGIMAMPATRSLWDLAIHSSLDHTEQMIGLRVLLVRFLAQALADYGVLCYWGTVKEDSIYIMKQGASFGEAVFVDLKNKMVFFNSGEIKMGSSVKIVRKDKESAIQSSMTREDLIGFLSVSTCLLSFSGLTPSMKKSIYELSAVSRGSYAITEGQLNL